MPFLRDFTGQPLQWKRPRFFSTTYHLHAGDQFEVCISSYVSKYSRFLCCLCQKGVLV